MGQNLVLNMDDRGYTVAVYNRTTARTTEFLGGPARGTRVIGTRTLGDLVAALKRPRRIMLMVKAGGAVDGIIEQLVSPPRRGGHHHRRGQLVLRGLGPAHQWTSGSGACGS